MSEMDEDELEDHIHGAIANAIQACSARFREEVPQSLADGLRSNNVSDLLARAVFKHLGRLGYKIVPLSPPKDMTRR